MNLLQQLLGGGPAAIQTRHLLRRCNQPTVSIDVLRREIEAAEREQARHRGHFGLAFALGHACERAVAASAWEERGPWTERALAHYEAAIDLAASGQIEGSDLIPAAAAAAWEDALPPRQRA